MNILYSHYYWVGVHLKYRPYLGLESTWNGYIVCIFSGVEQKMYVLMISLWLGV